MNVETENDTNNMRNDPLFIPPLQQPQNRHHHQQNHYGVRMYVLISFIGALFAIMTTPTPIPTTNGTPVISSPENNNNNNNNNNNPATKTTIVSKEDLFSVENVAKAAILGTQQKQQNQQQQLLENENNHDNGKQEKKKKDKFKRKSLFVRWVTIWKEQKVKAMENNQNNHDNNNNNESQRPSQRRFFSLSRNWTLDNPFSADSATVIIDKVLSSTPRIIAIANLLLAVTYLLHSLVADYFLGPTTTNIHHRAANNNNNNNNNIDGTNLRMDAPLLNTNDRREGGNNNNDNTTNGSHFHRSGRERLGGYLMFKLLLISAVVEPDSLDLLILSSWYTLLSFLRSLSHLCGSTISHTAQSGQPPRVGVCYLLILLLTMNFLSAAVCAALFHGAGWNMVLLLTCDCALLANDIVVHLIRYIQQSMDEKHSISLAIMEEQQLLYHAQMRSTSPRQEQQDQVEGEEGEDEAIRMNSRLLDRQMELQEAAHSRRLGVLDNVAFGLEIVSLALTFAHFVHIWSLHGITFGLVDGVLVLHLHSALSQMGKKILERRNLHRIARDLNCIFQDASEHEMKKAGDICCICLGSLSIGHVKKVGCGHLYHTNCLREVVERAQSIEAAKCPLCRAHVIDGSRQQQQNTTNTNTNTPIPTNNNDNNGTPQDETTNNNNNNAITNNAAVPPVNAGNGLGGEHALFRFSTEGILPSWIPIPAFSFEVVRRPPTNTTATATNNNNNNNNNNNRVDNPNANNGDALNNEDLAVVNNNNNGQQGGEMSFWRRLFILTGVLPMTRQEEISALNQLVDMFPQYDRADLLRELRERRSPEAVVESVLMGVFSGQPRTDGFDAVPTPATQNNDQAQNNPHPNNNLEATDTTARNSNSGNDTDVGETTVTENATTEGNENSPNPR